MSPAAHASSEGHDLGELSTWTPPKTPRPRHRRQTPPPNHRLSHLPPLTRRRHRSRHRESPLPRIHPAMSLTNRISQKASSSECPYGGLCPLPHPPSFRGARYYEVPPYFAETPPGMPRHGVAMLNASPGRKGQQHQLRGRHRDRSRILPEGTAYHLAMLLICAFGSAVLLIAIADTFDVI